MPIIRVEMFKGRTIEQKKKLVLELTDAFVQSCGGSSQGVQILIDEYEKENWATGGTLNSQRIPKGSSSEEVQ